MDEVLFRSSQKIENLQVQIGLAAAEGKSLLQHYSEYGKAAFSSLFNSLQSERYKDTIREFWLHILSICRDLHNSVFHYVNVKQVYENLIQLLSKQWTKRDIYVACIGFACGGIVGITIGFIIFKRNPIHYYMQAVQCIHYWGTESVSVVEDAIAPYQCDKNEVLVNVKAASVQVIDAQICNGYGRTIRKFLSKYNKYYKSDLPVTLGRDCTGVVSDIGQNVSRLEVGDEVWLTVPFWAPGTMCQTIAIPECKISRKPKTIGYESACSLPYAGSIALSTLKDADITPNNAQSKRILVIDGCTPVGCVLIQILKLWGAHITTTCYKRAAPVAKALGANDIIIEVEDTTVNSLDIDTDKKSVLKELELHDRFNVIICTKKWPINSIEMQTFCNENGKIISTVPPILKSDSYGLIMQIFFGAYIRTKCSLQRIFGNNLHDFDETHMCYVFLDQLTSYVENGDLQTVVDKVYHPQDIEIALNHIQSVNSIGSTVVTFR